MRRTNGTVIERLRTYSHLLLRHPRHPHVGGLSTNSPSLLSSHHPLVGGDGGGTGGRRRRGRRDSRVRPRRDAKTLRRMVQESLQGRIVPGAALLLLLLLLLLLKLLLLLRSRLLLLLDLLTEAVSQD